MTLKPLGDRILIKPEQNPEQTASGLWLSEHKKPATMGTVIAVGFCEHPLRAEAIELARRLNARAEACGDHDDADELMFDAATMLRDLVARKPSVKPGDLVVFSWTVGREVTLDDTGDTYLMIPEADLEAVVETA